MYGEPEEEEEARHATTTAIVPAPTIDVDAVTTRSKPTSVRTRRPERSAILGAQPLDQPLGLREGEQVEPQP